MRHPSIQGCHKKTWTAVQVHTCALFGWHTNHDGQLDDHEVRQSGGLQAQRTVRYGTDVEFRWDLRSEQRARLLTRTGDQ